MVYRWYYTVARTYEVYLWVEKYLSAGTSTIEIFFLREDTLHMFKPTFNFFFYYIDISVSKIKNWTKNKGKKKGMTSAISSLVRIWKIYLSYPGCSFIWNLRVAYFTVNTHIYVIKKFICCLILVCFSKKQK